MSEILRNVFRFLILIFVQVFLLDNVDLFGYAFPFIYIFFIMFLPLRIPNWGALIIAFITGFTIDVFTDTIGLHTAACTLIGFVRPFILRRLTPQYDPEEEMYLDIYNRTVSQYVIYAFLMSFIFCTAFILLERFSIIGLLTIIGQIFASTFLTFALLVIYRYLFVPASLKGKT